MKLHGSADEAIASIRSFQKLSTLFQEGVTCIEKSRLLSFGRVKVGTSEFDQTKTIGLSEFFLPIVGSEDIIERASCAALSFAIAS